MSRARRERERAPLRRSRPPPRAAGPPLATARRTGPPSSHGGTGTPAADSGGAIVVDFVGHLEDVDTGLAQVWEAVGLPPLAGPHVNGTGRGRRDTETYDDRSRGVVATLYRRDIETFGYELGR